MQTELSACAMVMSDFLGHLIGKKWKAHGSISNYLKTNIKWNQYEVYLVAISNPFEYFSILNH